MAFWTAYDSREIQFRQIFCVKASRTAQKCILVTFGWFVCRVWSWYKCDRRPPASMWVLLTKAFLFALFCNVLYLVFYLSFLYTYKCLYKYKCIYIYWTWCVSTHLRDDPFTDLTYFRDVFLGIWKGKQVKWRDASIICEHYDKHAGFSFQVFFFIQVHHFTVCLCMQSLIDWCHFLFRGSTIIWAHLLMQMHNFWSWSDGSYKDVKLQRMRLSEMGFSSLGD